MAALDTSKRLFPRAWKVVVQTSDTQAIDVSGLDIEFEILRSLKPTPNRAVVKVHNLNESHRGELLKRNKPDGPNGRSVPVFVQVEAGYNDKTHVLLSANLREVASKRERDEWITTLSMDDGGTAVRGARFPEGGIQFTKGTPIGQVLRKACAALGVGLGNAGDYETNAEVFGWGKTLPHTMTLTGSAFDSLRRVIDSIGITFSIQNGVLQLLPKGKPFFQTAVFLSPDTGLLDSPEAAIDSTVSLGFAREARGQPGTQKPPTPKNTGILKAKAMLIPGLVPGAVVRLESLAFKGNYEISEVKSTGASWDKSRWHNEMVLRSYIT